MTARRSTARVLDAEQVRAARASFGLDGGPAMTGEEAFEAVMARGTALPLANGWRLARTPASVSRKRSGPRLAAKSMRTEVPEPGDPTTH